MTDKKPEILKVINERIRGAQTTRNMYTIDYHTFTTVDTPKESRDRLGVGDIYTNAARCYGCKEVVRSRNRHDFRYCKCGNVAVDGGSWYAKRTFKEDGPGFENIVVPFTDVGSREELESRLKV